MPYELEQGPVGRGYFVVSKDTGRRHSDKPLPKQRAIRQMRALYLHVADADKMREKK
jgi:hypothetical protein